MNPDFFNAFNKNDDKEWLERAETGKLFMEAARLQMETGIVKPTKEHMNDVMRDFMKIITPSSVSNISASSLKQKLIYDYISDTSQLLVKNYKVREVKIAIFKNDEDLFPILKENWEKNNYHVDLEYEVVKDENGHTIQGGVKYFMDDDKIQRFAVTITW